MDISNYTGTLTDQGCQDLKDAGYVGCIIQAITGLDGRTYTRQQLDACVRNGLRIDGYLWCFPGSSVLSRCAMFDGFEPERLWLDVEERVSAADVQRDLDAADGYFGKLTGIYTGKWFWDMMGWSSGSRWSDRPLWDSNYDGVPDASYNFRPYGGWTHATIKQFMGTSNVGSVRQVDLNVTAA